MKQRKIIKMLNETMAANRHVDEMLKEARQANVKLNNILDPVVCYGGMWMRASTRDMIRNKR